MKESSLLHNPGKSKVENDELFITKRAKFSTGRSRDVRREAPALA
jgi:hypothetical protein